MKMKPHIIKHDGRWYVFESLQNRRRGGLWLLHASTVKNAYMNYVSFLKSIDLLKPAYDKIESAKNVLMCTDITDNPRDGIIKAYNILDGTFNPVE